MPAHTSNSRALRSCAATLAAALSLAMGLAAGCKKPAAGPPQMPPAPVRTVAPTIATVAVYRDYPANTLSMHTVDIIPRVTGWIDTQGFVNGQMVEEGQLLYVIDPRPYAMVVERTKADVAVVEADLKNAREKVERNRPLLDVVAISRQEFDQLVANQRSLEATLDARRAALDEASLNLSFTRITSPIKGQVSATAVYAGTYVTPAKTLTNLQQLDPIYVEFEPVAAEIPALRAMQAKAERDTEASLPGGGWKRLGKVVFIDNTVNAKTSTIRARLEVENKDLAIAPGAYVNVRLKISEIADAVSVPETAIVYQTAVATLWTIGPDGKAKQKVVRTGPRGGAGIVILHGLEPTDRVVLEGMQKLFDGAQTVDADAMRASMQGGGAPPQGAAR